MNLPSWRQTDGQRPTAAKKANWLLVDENAFMQKNKSEENAFMPSCWSPLSVTPCRSPTCRLSVCLHEGRFITPKMRREWLFSIDFLAGTKCLRRFQKETEINESLISNSCMVGFLLKHFELLCLVSSLFAFSMRMCWMMHHLQSTCQTGSNSIKR